MGIKSLFIAIIIISIPFQAHASRGFGSTLGVVATDSVQTAYSTGISTTISYSFWVLRNSDGGGGGIGRIYNQSGSFILNSIGTNSYNYEPTFSTTTGIWSMTRPATGSWHHILIT